MDFTDKAGLIAFLTDLQGQITAMQETVDKLAPVAEEPPESETLDPAAETPPAEELDELDSLLQSS